MGISVAQPQEWLFIHCFQVELEFRNAGFCGGRKTGVSRENPSEQGREPTINSTCIWCQLRESNPGHIVGRRVLSALRHPCSHNFETLKQFFPNYIHTFNNGCGIFISIFSHQLSSSVGFSTYSWILSKSFPSSLSDGFSRLAKCITACFLRP